MAKQRTLTRAAVVEMAARLADEAGSADALTLTALAEALAIRTPSLYNHVSGLEDLRQALAEQALRAQIAVLRAATAGQHGRTALRTLALAYRDYARAHPGTYRLTIAAPDPADAALTALAEELLQLVLLLLATAGVTGERALHGVRGLRALLHGYMALEEAGGYQLPLDRAASFLSVVDMYLDGLLHASDTPDHPRTT